MPIGSAVWDTPERLALRETVRDFVGKHVLPHQDQWERDGELPRSLHRAAAELGLLGIGIPEEVGGSHLIYLPRYLPDDDPDFAKPDEAFYEPFMAALQRIFWRRGFRPDEVVLWRVFRTRFVSPLHVLRYDELRLPVQILPGQLYLLNTGRVLGGTLNNNQMIEEAELGLGEIG